MIRKNIKFLYPFVFGLFPVFSLYLNNYFQVEFFRTIRSIVISIIITGLIYLLMVVIFRQKAYSRLFASASIIVFFTYGTFYSFLTAHPIFGVNIGRARFLITILLVLFILFIVLLIRNRKRIQTIEDYAGLLSIALVVVLGVNFIFVRLSTIKYPGINQGHTIIEEGVSSIEKPDIYHIILDGYTSSAVLAMNFNFDNEYFEDNLMELGFIIPKNSCSNYDMTLSSLGSELNLDWVSDLFTPAGQDPHKLELSDWYVNNRTRTFLEGQGYKIFSFENEYKWALWTNVDFYRTPRERSYLQSALNSFERIFLDNTILRLAINYDRIRSEEFFESLLDKPLLMNLDKYEEQSYIIESLPEIPQQISPKFVYAHTTITHVPFVFNVDGSVLDSARQGSNDSDFTDPAVREGYIISIQYSNEKILNIVETIITKNPEAIIILQGDHGYPGDNRHAIFLAVYDPRQSIQGYETMTLVNLYRLLFNHWFGTNYELLNNNLYREIPDSTYEYVFIGVCEDQLLNDR